MVKMVYDKKYYLLQNTTTCTSRGHYQVSKPYRTILSMSMECWEQKTKAGKDLAIRKMLEGTYPIKLRKEEETIYWGGAKQIAIDKDKVEKTKKKVNQKSNRNKTENYSVSLPEPRLPDVAGQNKSSSSEGPSMTPPALKKIKKNCKREEIRELNEKNFSEKSESGSK